VRNNPNLVSRGLILSQANKGKSNTSQDEQATGDCSHDDLHEDFADAF